MNPHIEVQTRSINSQLNYNDPEYDDAMPSLYHVVISEGTLKVLGTVEWRNPDQHPREFQLVRFDHLYLDGQDKGQAYPIGKVPFTGQLSADPTIVQDLFKQALDPYGIRLDKVTIHNHHFYESINFAFADEALLNELYDRINEVCLKVKYSPGSLA